MTRYFSRRTKFMTAHVDSAGNSEWHPLSPLDHLKLLSARAATEVLLISKRIIFPYVCFLAMWIGTIFFAILVTKSRYKQAESFVGGVSDGLTTRSPISRILRLGDTDEPPPKSQSGRCKIFLRACHPSHIQEPHILSTLVIASPHDSICLLI